MFLTIVDVIILLFLLMGAVIGFKRGVIQSATMFLGIIAVIIISYYLKNPLSKLMYTFLPFFKFSGSLEGVSVLNILIYEGIAFIAIFLLLTAVLNILIKVTGIVEKILKFTIILGIPSKLLGAVFGIFEQFVYLFVILFLVSRLSFTADYISESRFANKILASTPVLSGIVEKSYQSFEEIYGLKEKYKDTTDKNEYNKESLDILLKYGIIKPDGAEKLIDNGKLKITGAEEIIKKYKEEQK